MGRARMIVRGFAGAGAVLLAACSQQATTQPTAQPTAAAAATHPVTGLRIIPVSVTTAAGRTHRFRAELADTPAAQQRGLMFRTTMAPDEAMLFPSATLEERSFWMKNTPLPLDIIFIGADRRVLNIEPGVPYELQPVFSKGPAAAVLELNQGRAAALGIAPGDAVAW